jgi:conjugative transfer signal peptidase TraF
MNLISSFKKSKFLQLFYGFLALVSTTALLMYTFGVQIYWNTTASNPYKLFIGSTFYTPKENIYVVTCPDFGFNSTLKNMLVIKKIKGLPGDYLTSHHHTICLNGKDIGQIENLEEAGITLSPIDSQIIPKDFYYLGSDQQTHGFDSRYAQFGLIHHNQIRCRVWPIY